MKRAGFFHRIAVGALGTAVLPQRAFSAFTDPDPLADLFYVGCYTAGADEGIPSCLFDPVSGSFTLQDTCKKVENPSFLISDRFRQFVFAANETDNFGGRTSGAVSVFMRDKKTGKLTFLNSQPSQGAHPCHLTLDRTEKFLLVANYTGGNASVFPLLGDGRIGEASDRVQHTGQGFNPSRQEAPHAHSVNMSPDNRFVFICDLGIDKIMVYRFDDKKGRLTPAETPFFQTAAGAGPRHFVFSKDGGMAFVVNELNSTITSFKYDSKNGKLSELQTLTTLPKDFTGENTCADIHIHPNGRFIYASNRGHDSIAVFAREKFSGNLNLVQNQPTLGKTPRNFAIHASGRFLLAANQNSNSIHSFLLNPDSGKLTPTGQSVVINKPVCILF